MQVGRKVQKIKYVFPTTVDNDTQNNSSLHARRGGLGVRIPWSPSRLYGCARGPRRCREAGTCSRGFEARYYELVPLPPDVSPDQNAKSKLKEEVNVPEAVRPPVPYSSLQKPTNAGRL